LIRHGELARGLRLHLLKHTEKQRLEEYLRLYRRCFNPDERVSTRVLRWVIQPSPRRVNPVHLFAAYLNKELVGGACTVVFPAFQAVFGSYIFVAPRWRGQGFGEKILREVLRKERSGTGAANWRLYAEITASSGDSWHKLLERVGFQFFKADWPLCSYEDPSKVIPGRLCYYPFRRNPPARFSQPAFLAYVHTLFYGPESMHRHLLPRLREFVRLDAG